MFCEVAAVPRPPGTRVSPTATSSPPGRAGPLAASAWPAIRERGSVTYTIDVHLSPDEVRRQMRADAVAGLLAPEKSIPPVWFYDERGSELFEEITQLPEYYPTRAERRLLESHAPEIANLAKADTLVELGAGACSKTRVILDALERSGTLARYVPFDVSDEFLRNAATALCDEYEALAVHLVIGDFHQHLAEIPTEGRRMVAFLGGTIGNLD